MPEHDKEDDAGDVLARQIEEILARSEFGNEETTCRVTVENETTELNLRQVAEFLLGEREAAENLFGGFTPQHPDIDLIIVRVKDKEDWEILFYDTKENPGLVSIEVRIMKGLGERAGEYHATVGDCLSHAVLDRENIILVRFEIIELQDKARIRSVLFENDGGYFVRICDTGMMECFALNEGASS